MTSARDEVLAYAYRPGAIYLNVTNRCSNDCSFCVRRRTPNLAGYDLRLRREPPLEAVRRGLDEVREELGGVVEEVVFCGYGEPTYRLDVIEALGRELRDEGICVRLNTNGQAALLNPERDVVATLLKAVDVVSVSLNAPNVERYVELCRPRFGAEAFEALQRFAVDCRDAGIEVWTTAVAFTLAAKEIVACETLAVELGVKFRRR